MMMNMMTGAVAINGGVGVMEIRQPQMVEKAVQDAGHIAADIAENAHTDRIFMLVKNHVLAVSGMGDEAPPTPGGRNGGSDVL